MLLFQATAFWGNLLHSSGELIQAAKEGKNLVEEGQPPTLPGIHPAAYSLQGTPRKKSTHLRKFESQLCCS